MGCDIHAAIEFKNGNGWEALKLPNPWHGKYGDEEAITARLHLNRDYDMFAILAGVRNGVGFAGIRMSDPFVPIAESRGLPEGVTPETVEQALTGDHSGTWVALPELLAYDWTRSTTHYGVLNASAFEHWDRMKAWHPAPESYSGDVSGGNVQKVTPEQMRKAIATVDLKGLTNEAIVLKLQKELPNLYTRISWQESYAESGKQIWLKILPKMLALGNQYGFDNVRMVMNFDN